MFSILFALSIMLWMWAAVMRHAVVVMAASASPAQQRVYLGMAVGAGAAVLLALLAKMLPLSLLTAGWSQERLADVVSSSALVACVAVVMALWRAHYLFPRLVASGKPDSAKAAQKEDAK